MIFKKVGMVAGKQLPIFVCDEIVLLVGSFFDAQFIQERRQLDRMHGLDIFVKVCDGCMISVEVFADLIVV